MGISGCISLTFRDLWPFESHAQAFMIPPVGRLWDLVEFLRFGVTTNFWGLGCPQYCGPPSWTSLALTFVLGFTCGLLAAGVLVGLALYQLGFVQWPTFRRAGPSPAGVPSSRLQGYLHGLWTLWYPYCTVGYPGSTPGTYSGSGSSGRCGCFRAPFSWTSSPCYICWSWWWFSLSSSFRGQCFFYYFSGVQRVGHSDTTCPCASGRLGFVPSSWTFGRKGAC